MKKIALSIIPLMLAGFFIPGENCGNAVPQPEKYDGPFVLYKNDKVYINYILAENDSKQVRTDSMPLSQKDSAVLETGTGESAFSFHLKPSLQNEPSEYPA